MSSLSFLSGRTCRSLFLDDRPRQANRSALSTEAHIPVLFDLPSPQDPSDLKRMLYKGNEDGSRLSPLRSLFC